MAKKLDSAGATPAAETRPEIRPETDATRRALEAHKETRDIAVELQRHALRLSELGHMKAGADVLRAAVRCTRVRPGQSA